MHEEMERQVLYREQVVREQAEDRIEELFSDNSRLKSQMTTNYYSKLSQAIPLRLPMQIC